MELKSLELKRQPPQAHAGSLDQALTRSFCYSWLLLGRSWPVLGRSWPLLAVPGRSWATLGPLLGALGHPWAALRSLLLDLGPILGLDARSWVALGDAACGPGPLLEPMFAVLGRSWALC